MGKSVAAGYLGGFGLPVIDTDVVARQLVEPGQQALDEIRATFGAAVIGADGRLRRAALAGIVFADEVARRRLEAILHPRIRAVWRAEVRGWGAAGHRAGVVVIPLLFETGASSAFDATLCVACSEASQMTRLSDRGWSAVEIKRRIGAQWPIQRKLAASDFVVWAEGGADRTREQLQRILGHLQVQPDAIRFTA